MQQLKHRILVCGGRKYGEVDLDVPEEHLDDAMRNAAVEREYLHTVLSNLKEKLEIECILEGRARGADHHASQWAKINEVKNYSYPANWKQYGKKAGSIRNQTMLDHGKPTLVIAFPGGKGTKDMVERAKKAGVPVYEVSYETIESTCE